MPCGSAIPSVTVILSHFYVYGVHPLPAWHPSPSRLSSPSRHARAREALADVREIIFLSRGRMHEFVIQVRGYVKKFVHAAIRELQLQSPKGIRILMISDFGDAVRGNGDPIHLLRAPFRLRRLFHRPAREALSGRSPRLYPGSACSSWAALRGSSPASRAPTAGFSCKISFVTIEFFNLFDVSVVASGAARARIIGHGECHYKAKLPNPNRLALDGARQVRTKDYFFSFSPEV